MTLVWVYAIAGAGAAAWGSPPRGLEDGEVRAVVEGDLAALVGDVPEGSYEQPALDRSVADAAWLEARATAHQAVNAAAHAALRSTLPVPFATIYRSDEGVREMLRGRADEVRAKLRALEGRAEFVVGLYRDTARAAEHLSRARDAVAHEAVAPGAGRRYLEERKGAVERREDLARLDDEAAASVRRAVEPVTAAAYAEPVVDGSGDLVARTTYLLRRADQPRFVDAVGGFNSEWRERGYEARAIGPWPPYRSAREPA